jgi:hypothetical protein
VKTVALAAINALPESFASIAAACAETREAATFVSRHAAQLERNYVKGLGAFLKKTPVAATRTIMAAPLACRAADQVMTAIAARTSISARELPGRRIDVVFAGWPPLGIPSSKWI